MRRNKYEIIGEILKIALNGANKTRIVYQANLNFKIINKYLNLLLKQDFLRKIDNNYHTTETGSEYDQNLRKILI